jgi:hypothetical protein
MELTQAIIDAAIDHTEDFIREYPRLQMLTGVATLGDGLFVGGSVFYALHGRMAESRDIDILVNDRYLPDRLYRASQWGTVNIKGLGKAALLIPNYPSIDFFTTQVYIDTKDPVASIGSFPYTHQQCAIKISWDRKKATFYFTPAFKETLKTGVSLFNSNRGCKDYDGDSTPRRSKEKEERYAKLFDLKFEEEPGSQKIRNHNYHAFDLGGLDFLVRDAARRFNHLGQQ